MQAGNATAASILQRLRNEIPLSTDRDRLRVALLSAARENSFLLEAAFNRRTARLCVPIQPMELAELYKLAPFASNLNSNEVADPFNFTTVLRDFFADKQNCHWNSRRGVQLMQYMIHTIDAEEFFCATMGSFQRSDLRRLELLISEYEQPDAILLNELTQQIADDICTGPPHIS